MAPAKWYVRSLYWVITTVSTTGFGDITPLNTTETVLAVVAIFCGGMWRIMITFEYVFS